MYQGRRVVELNIKGPHWSSKYRTQNVRTVNLFFLSDIVSEW